MKFCVIGLGQFGRQLAKTLAENGGDVLAVDQNEQNINAIQQFVSQAICIKITDEASLEPLGIEDMDVVLVAIGESFDQTVLISTLLKHRARTGKVIARAVTGLQKEALKLIGVDEVIRPEQETAINLADTLSSPFVNLARLSPQFCIGLIEAPGNFIGKTLGELKLYDSHKVNCVGLKRDEEYVTVNNNYVILEHDKLIVAGKPEKLEALASS